ncbi:hypothetical protein NLG97_g4013 [Lecanicillium saksenae]|uniref:Uncharacterized protein n=1 Tax=Lecanicillium saksenae TaxID=468837 RepID=A0ACC1QZN9_9HYPO|nr:hypothetical protein NLG97_g4013 [Lecanicillium saksenae]
MDLPPLFGSSGVECIFFRKGHGFCARGTNCRFVHAFQTEGLARTSFWRPPISEKRFLPGASGLRSDHPPPYRARSCQTLPPYMEEEPIEPEEDEIPELAWVRHLKGVYVTFGPGATVAAISMPWEYSAVRLNNLPADCTASTVAEYLGGELGFPVPEDRIELQPVLVGETTADVTMDNPDFAKTLLNALDDHETVNYRALALLPPKHRAARFNAISSSKVTCSWHKPNRTAWLNFGSLATASQVKTKFARSDYRVDGIRVLPGLPVVGDGPKAASWKLKLDNVPATASRSEIVEDIEKNYLPFHVELSRATYAIPIEAATNEILKLLMGVGPLDPSTIGLPESQGRRYKVTAGFVDGSDAVAAIKLLNYKPLPFFEHGKLTVQQVYTVRMRIPEYVYAAATQDIDAMFREWRENYINVTISNAYKGFRGIAFEGQSRQHVAEAQASLESIAAGELLTEDGMPLWSASFATNAWAYNKMRDLERHFGISVLCDRQKRTLRMLGPRHVFGLARLEVSKLCNLDPRREYYIHLEPEALPWLLRGGYQHIGKTVGRDKVGLDVASEPRYLVISGSEADLQVVQGLYHNRSQLPEPAVSSIGPDDCSLCGFEAEHAVFTECQHLYCGRCFEDIVEGY